MLYLGEMEGLLSPANFVDFTQTKVLVRYTICSTDVHNTDTAHGK